MELFKIGILTVTLADGVDIALVSFISYRLYLAMRGTIAIQILAGLLIILAFSFVADALDFKAMSAILRTLTDIWVIAFIILFQPELRRLLILVGRNPVVRLFLKMDVDESINEVVTAVSELCRKKIGALIVFTRATGIRMHVETVHLELLGTLEGIAEAKAELIAGVRPGGVAVVPADCRPLQPFLVECGRRVVRFAVGSQKSGKPTCPGG